MKIAVVGPKGSAGRTVVATSVALYMHATVGPTALVDLGNPPVAAVLMGVQAPAPGVYKGREGVQVVVGRQEVDAKVVVYDMPPGASEAADVAVVVHDPLSYDVFKSFSVEAKKVLLVLNKDMDGARLRDAFVLPFSPVVEYAVQKKIPPLLAKSDAPSFGKWRMALLALLAEIAK